MKHEYYLQARNIIDGQWVMGQKMPEDPAERQIILDRWQTFIGLDEYAKVEIRVIRVEVK
jgi:hypothetical protein